MGVKEIKKWLVRCDWYQCDTPPVITEDVDEPDAPEGWGYHTSGGWGITNYTKTELLCPKHLAARERENAS